MRLNAAVQRMVSAWWRHQMETFSALLAFSAGNSLVTGEFSAQRPVKRSFGVFSLICAWINAWVNNRGAGDLRRHRVNHDVILMVCMRKNRISNILANEGRRHIYPHSLAEAKHVNVFSAFEQYRLTYLHYTLAPKQPRWLHVHVHVYLNE